MSVFLLLLAHSRDDGGSIVSEDMTNTYTFWQSFAAERFVSRSSYSQCRITYVKCSDKGAKEMHFSALGSGFWKEPSGWWASMKTWIYSHIPLQAQRIQVPLTPDFISMRLILYLFLYCNWRWLMNNLVGLSRRTSGVTLKVHHPKTAHFHNRQIEEPLRASLRCWWRRLKPGRH